MTASGRDAIPARSLRLNSKLDLQSGVGLIVWTFVLPDISRGTEESPQESLGQLFHVIAEGIGVGPRKRMDMRHWEVAGYTGDRTKEMSPNGRSGIQCR